MASFGVDTLGGLTEKLKQLISDTQEHYESLIDSTQKYKQGKMNDKEYFASVGKYLIANSAMNFLAVRVILELKSSLDSGTSAKNPAGNISTTTPSSGTTQGFGVTDFVSGGGSIGQNTHVYPQSSSHIEPTLKPVDIISEKPSPNNKTSDIHSTKNCKSCNMSIPIKAKFCSKCGNPQ
ncbi:MAG: hypothetical protein ACPKPY_13905 [Nitrososphaeraceae archaeon]